MTGFQEVGEPILNGPFGRPARHWRLEPGEPPEVLPGRRGAGYWYRDPRAGVQDGGGSRGVWRPMPLAALLRDRVAEWQAAGRPGLTRTSADLIAWWEREGRHPRLFFAQMEAAETVIFLTEARADFLQGIEVPADPPPPERVAEGYAGFRRFCTKMATGTGKSTVAAMLAAWSILNKVADRGDARFSDTVLIVCPNVTIRSRLGELDPQQGDASLYRTRDLVPPALMDDLRRGQVLVRNWHGFEPQQPGGARVERRGVPRTRTEWVVIGPRNTSARGKRYYTPTAYGAAVAAGELEVLNTKVDAAGDTTEALVRVTRWEESDAALVGRVLGTAKGNLLVINDEAHHAYRIPPEEPEDQDGLFDDEDEDTLEADRREATVWVDGLDRIQRVRGINLCVDLSATPYFLGRMGGATNTAFPWVVSDFGLTDAIEAGLVKVPQLVAADSTGRALPAYFNIWEWIRPQLTARERGPVRGSPRPEAILKHAHTPLAILGGMWSQELRQWAAEGEPRPPVFILVAKNKAIARALFGWIADGESPPGVAPLNLPDLANTDGRVATIRVDTGVVRDTDSGNAQTDDTRWMRLTLDTVGRLAWPADPQGRPVYPEGFEALAAKLHRPLHPPGRDIRCIVSVGMLTEGWDCNTVTHVIGLRPFQSQLLCEQVVGRALRRRSYALGEDGLFQEEPAYVFGVPFEVIPFKATNASPKPKPAQRRIYAVPAKAAHAIEVPNVQGFQAGVRNRITAEPWDTVAPIVLDPLRLPPDAAMAAALDMNRPRMDGPGGSSPATLAAFRAANTRQRLAFQMAAELTRIYVRQPGCEAPAHVLFAQVLRIVERYLREKVEARPPADVLDTFLSPYYGLIVERLLGAIRPDTEAGEAPEVPDVDEDRPLRTANVSLFTPKPVREAARTHLNLVLFDTQTWEQSAAYTLDTHPAVRSFAANQGLGFTIRYLHNGGDHDYVPDFVARLDVPDQEYLIVEIKGPDWGNVAEVKAQAAVRWCEAVTATGRFGTWRYKLAWKVSDLVVYLDDWLAERGKAAAD